jgi:hypothetical protein
MKARTIIDSFYCTLWVLNLLGAACCFTMGPSLPAWLGFTTIVVCASLVLVWIIRVIKYGWM